MNHSVVYLECVVECVPQCHVWWKRNNRSIHADYGHHLPRHWDREHRDRTELDRIFKVKASPVQSSLRLGHFSAVKSLLYWNLTELADINIDGDTFTCESSGNEAGSGVSSSIRFKLECEYPVPYFERPLCTLRGIAAAVCFESFVVCFVHVWCTKRWMIALM